MIIETFLHTALCLCMQLLRRAGVSGTKKIKVFLVCSSTTENYVEPRKRLVYKLLEKTFKVLLNNDKEIDMFKNTYKQFDKKKIFFLVNDLNKKIQDKEQKKIIKILEEDNLNYDFLKSV